VVVFFRVWVKITGDEVDAVEGSEASEECRKVLEKEVDVTIIEEVSHIDGQTNFFEA